MRFHRHIFLIAGFSLLGGCSGGSSLSGAGIVQGASGRATVSVTWPADSRLIPLASSSIRVSLTQSGLLVGEATLVRPSGGGVASASFPKIPVGAVAVSASAFPNADATGTAQAQGTVAITVIANQTTPVNLTLGSTIVDFSLTPATATLATGAQATLGTTAKDASGALVLTSSSKIEWTSLTPSLATVDGAGRVSALAAGTATIQARETESGKTATAVITVTAGSGGGGGGGATSDLTLDLKANDIVYDRQRNKVWASVPSTAPTGGNSVVSIDPQTGTLGTPIFVGSEPGKLAISDDGQFLYAALNGAAAVRRVDLASQAADLQFSLGSGTFGTGARYAEDIAVQPGNAHTVAISLRNQGFSPRHEGVFIYDDGVQRPTGTQSHTGSNRIEFATPTRIFGYNNETTEFGFRRLTVSGSGVTEQDVVSNIITNFYTDIFYDNGRIYATTGAVVDAENKTLVGTLNSSGLITADGGLAWVLQTPFGGSSSTLRAYSTTTFSQAASQTFTGVAGSPIALIRVGANGIAFLTDGGKVYVVGRAPGL